MNHNSNIKISLIITVYNRIELLRKCLLSLLHQSIQPHELIISDDGSTDDIVEGIKDIVGNFNFPVKFLSQPNKGFRLAKVRNNAVIHSTGDLLIFLDQDIILTKNYIKTFVENVNAKRFLTSYPIRLSENQSDKISEEIIRSYSYLEYLNPKQTNKIKKQFVRDYISYIGYKAKIVKQKPKLRGGVCAINRVDYMAINGYDENFVGWGNEDDDLRKRLYKFGVSGYNPFFNEFPLHLYHEPFHNNGERVNKKYVNAKSSEIAKGNYFCEKGIINSNMKELFIKQIN